MNKEKLGEALVRIVGKDNFSDDPATLMCYAVDTNPHNLPLTAPRPDFVVLADTEEQVAEIVCLANREKVPVVPRGAGSSRRGGTSPLYGGIVIDMKKMNKILEINEEDMWVRVQPGCTYRVLLEELNKKGFTFGIEPGSVNTATIGGGISTDGSGWQKDKYGDMSALVLSLVVVLPTGEIIKTCRNVQKSATGYNLTHLFIGAEGTLGIITEATLRILPKPESFEARGIGFSSIDAAFMAMKKILKTGMLPMALLYDEVFTRKYWKSYIIEELGEEYVQSIYEMKERIKNILILGFAGEKWEVKAALKRALKICMNEGGYDLGPEMGQSWFDTRKISGPIYAREQRGKRTAIESGMVPFSRIKELLDFYRGLVKKYGITQEGVVISMSLQRLGGFVPLHSFDDTDPEQLSKHKAAVQELRHKILSMGGSLTYGAIGGVGAVLTPFLVYERGFALEIMKRIKKALDPNNIMNPGKIVVL